MKNYKSQQLGSPNFTLPPDLPGELCFRELRSARRPKSEDQHRVEALLAGYHPEDDFAGAFSRPAPRDGRFLILKIRLAAGTATRIAMRDATGWTTIVESDGIAEACFYRAIQFAISRGADRAVAAKNLEPAFTEVEDFGVITWPHWAIGFEGLSGRAVLLDFTRPNSAQFLRNGVWTPATIIRNK